MKGGEERSMPTEEWLVKWKKNRNHRGEEEDLSRRKAIKLAEEKRNLGYKVRLEKVSSRPARVRFTKANGAL